VEVEVHAETITDASGKPLVCRRFECIEDALAEIRHLEARIMVQARTIRALAAEIALHERAIPPATCDHAVAGRSRCFDGSTSSDRQQGTESSS